MTTVGAPGKTYYAPDGRRYQNVNGSKVYLDDPAGTPGSSWDFVDLASILEGDDHDERATVLTRTDGVCLLYPGKVNAAYGEPECNKSWLAQHASAEQVEAGRHVIYVDFEDGPRGVVGRLVALGLKPADILARFHYIRPASALTQDDAALLEENLAATRPGLTVLDGVTEAMVLHGLDPVGNKDYALFHELLPRRIARLGPAVFVLDHVGRNKETRGRFAIGAQHKLAGVDGAAYALEVVRPFGKGCEGLSIVRVTKDRPGDVRQHAPGGKVAELVLRSHDDGTVSVSLQAPAGVDGDDFRPTHLMEKVSRLLERNLEPLSGVTIEKEVRGKAAYVRRALQVLVEEGYVGVEIGPRSARQHRPLKPFREEDNNE